MFIFCLTKIKKGKKIEKYEKRKKISENALQNRQVINVNMRINKLYLDHDYLMGCDRWSDVNHKISCVRVCVCMWAMSAILFRSTGFHIQYVRE